MSAKDIHKRIRINDAEVSHTYFIRMASFESNIKYKFCRQVADRSVEIFVSTLFISNVFDSTRSKLTFSGSNILGITKISFVFRLPTSYTKLGLIFILKIATAYVWVFSKSYKSEIRTDIFKRH